MQIGFSTSWLDKLWVEKESPKLKFRPYSQYYNRLHSESIKYSEEIFNSSRKSMQLYLQFHG